MDASQATAIADEIRDKIFATTQCTASIGIGPSMLLARLATAKAKPNRACVRASVSQCVYSSMHESARAYARACTRVLVRVPARSSMCAPMRVHVLQAMRCRPCAGCLIDRPCAAGLV